MLNAKHSVHADLEVMTVWVNPCVFYNMKEMSDPWVKAKVFGITCLEGKVPTFEILFDGYVFSEIPPHMISTIPVNGDFVHYGLKSLVYNNCLSDDFSIAHFGELENSNACVLLKDDGVFIRAKYWFSLDFYKNNNWYHCMLLGNGQIAFIPSHKIVFKDIFPSQEGLAKECVIMDVEMVGFNFPKYEKLRHSFSV